MNVYQTDTNGYFLHLTKASPDPLTPGNWLIPAGCVTVAPPAIAANEAAKWDGSTWAVVADFREVDYWLAHNDKHTITERGIAPPAGSFSTNPPKPLAQVKAEKLAQLQQARDKAAAANVTVQGKTFSAESKIADLFAKLADRARRSKPSQLAAIYQVDGSPVAPNHALLDAIEDAVADQIEAAWNKYGTLVGQVMAATNNTQVEAIAW